MFERFTEQARRVMQRANQEAQRLRHEYIGTEHILLGLLKEEGSAAVSLLRYFGVDPQEAVAETETLIERGRLADKTPPFTPGAKRVIEYSMEEARNLKHHHVGTEHLLLGLLRDDMRVGAAVLMNLGLELEKVRAEVRANLPGFADEGRPPAYEETTHPLDHDTKRRVRELAEKLALIQEAKEDLVARQAFDEAAKVRDKQDKYWTELRSLAPPTWVWRNVKRVAARGSFHSPVLEMLDDEAGQPDGAVLSLLPTPMLSPVKIVVGTVPRYPVSTLMAAIAPDDIGSPYFQACVPLVSPESVARVQKGQSLFVRAAFQDIRRAQESTWGAPVLLCIVHLSRLPQDVTEEVLAGLHWTACDFVVFDNGEEARSLLSRLPTGTRVLGG